MIKLKKKKIRMLTAYDYSLARILDETAIDIILVGDSLGNVILGDENTLSVTMADMVRHTQAVARGARRALVIADLPYRSVNLRNAQRLINAGARGVKIEGVGEIGEIKKIIKAGIPVMGHLGFLPQKIKEYGGYKIQRDPKIIDEAKLLEKAGVFALVLELIPPELAKKVTKAVKIPTIGIGAGKDCDGQVLVSYDMLGLYPKAPKFAKKYVDLSRSIKGAVARFIAE